MPEPQTCTLDIHQEIWDLHGVLTAEFFGPTNEPINVLHSNQAAKVKLKLTLSGTILHYLCETQIGCCLAFESCGPAVEFNQPAQWKTVNPCEEGGNLIEFEFDLPADTFNPGECGTVYTLCVTLGSKDCCGHSGFVYGHCHDIEITVFPPDVNA